jgi:hypothetical protein
MAKIDLVKVLAELDKDLVVGGVKEQTAAGNRNFQTASAGHGE